MRELRVQSGGWPLLVFYASIQRDRRFWSSAATRPATIASTTYTTTNIEEIRTEGLDSVTGHKPFNQLTKNFEPNRRARVAAKAAALREVMTLEELRKARSLSQEEVAEALTVGQPAVAKLEKRGDMHVGNLRRYVEALGGTLEIVAHFADTTVVISNVGEST
jgi:predicted XRE-type DNA-binding protein